MGLVNLQGLRIYLIRFPTPYSYLIVSSPLLPKVIRYSLRNCTHTNRVLPKINYLYSLKTANLISFPVDPLLYRHLPIEKIYVELLLHILELPRIPMGFLTMRIAHGP